MVESGKTIVEIAKARNTKIITNVIFKWVLFIKVEEVSMRLFIQSTIFLYNLIIFI
jgi:hypothetical protein